MRLPPAGASCYEDGPVPELTALDFGSLLASDLESVFASGFVSDFVSGFVSDFASGFVSDFVSGFVSDFASGFASVFASLLPLSPLFAAGFGFLKSVAYHPLPFKWNPAAVSILEKVCLSHSGQSVITGSLIFFRYYFWNPQDVQRYS